MTNIPCIWQLGWVHGPDPAGGPTKSYQCRELTAVNSSRALFVHLQGLMRIIVSRETIPGRRAYPEFPLPYRDFVAADLGPARSPPEKSPLPFLEGRASCAFRAAPAQISAGFIEASASLERFETLSIS